MLGLRVSKNKTSKGYCFFTISRRKKECSNILHKIQAFCVEINIFVEVKLFYGEVQTVYFEVQIKGTPKISEISFLQYLSSTASKLSGVIYSVGKVILRF